VNKIIPLPVGFGFYFLFGLGIDFTGIRGFCDE